MDYEQLKFIWWLLIGMLLIGLVLVEGLDQGARVLMPILARHAREPLRRDRAIASPQSVYLLWLAAIGCTLSLVWPRLGLMPCLGVGLIALLSLLRRYGLQLNRPAGNAWAWTGLVSGLLPALLIGIMLGNLFLGLPFSSCGQAGCHYHGALSGLFEPFAVLVGGVCLSMLSQLGAAWVMLHGDGAVRWRARQVTWVAGSMFLASFLGAVLWLGADSHGYSLSAVTLPGVLCSPSNGVVLPGNVGWQANYRAWPWAWLAPLFAITGAVLALFAAWQSRAGLALLGGGMATCATLSSAGFALFPFIVPSNLQLSASLTAWDAMGSEKTLGMMLIVASVLVPMLLAYTVYSLLKGWDLFIEPRSAAHSSWHRDTRMVRRHLALR
ncbi:cytochrome d ubiquinol oxidase subunit II [Pseudomonas defluvii]|uniref:cytochrome d ubiquinol oxidase subunit II n=1 Tax=Pseudomonas defluvii TaxID=1876757 RepID=UPI003905BCB2